MRGAIIQNRVVCANREKHASVFGSLDLFDFINLPRLIDHF